MATESTRSLQNTPTWAVATVIFFFISISIFIEHLIHLLISWLKRKRKTSLFEAVEKLKSGLILLGFLSLLLAVTQRPIAKICVPTKISNTMLPCRNKAADTTLHTTEALGFGYDRWTPNFWSPERKLEESSSSTEEDDDHEDTTDDNDETNSSPTNETSSDNTPTSEDSSDYCESKGMTALISEKGVNQLSIFIFVLAVTQIVYGLVTMALGRAKMKRWKAWEKETQTVEYQAANDPERFRFTRQTTFGRRHMSSCAQTSILLWIKCFFRQFFRSVAKVDYLTLRHAFIATHLSTNNTFNFQKYIQRSLDDDFKVVVGISPSMWFLVIVFLLVDVHGWHVYLWVSFLPLIIVLVLGTKLEVIVARMALQLQNQTNVIKGAPLVQPNDNLFWFGQPKYVLTLLHFTLFMNAFEFAFFTWVTLQFGIHSCYHESLAIIIIRVVLAITVQVLCSYITLPLYALVTQMGSHFKSAVLEQQTATMIKKWHEEVRHKQRRQKKPTPDSYNDRSISPSNSSYALNGGDDQNSPSSTVRSGNTTTTFPSPENSSHKRTPTFGEIEIVEEEEDRRYDMKRQQVVAQTPQLGSAFDSSGHVVTVHIEMPELSRT